jgi:hypothetical protein
MDSLVTHENDKAILAKIQAMIFRSFKSCQFCLARQDTESMSVVTECIPSFELEFIDRIKQVARGRLIDVRIWGVGYAPKVGVRDNWKPLSVEIVIAKDARKPNESAPESSDLECRTRKCIDVSSFNLDCIRDKNIARIVRQFLSCVAHGERPDVYHRPVYSVQYHKDEERGIHMVMVESMPTVNLAFLNKIRLLFDGILHNITFEKRKSTKTSRFSDTDSATTMIVELYDISSGSSSGYSRIKPNSGSGGVAPY